MTHSIRKRVISACLLAISMLGLGMHSAHASDAETKRIIDALQPDAGSKLKTRSLRNLQVESSGAATANEQKFISLSIGFKFNSAEITPESANTLGSLSQALKSDQLAPLEFMIEGHTDGKGTPDYNMKLSQQRAIAVKAYLEKQGVQAKRLRTHGKGDSELVNTEDRFAAENRRVKIVTLTP